MAGFFIFYKPNSFDPSKAKLPKPNSNKNQQRKKFLRLSAWDI